MSADGLERFDAYQKALRLFDFVVEDMTRHCIERKLERLVSQQIASADSVCSNIEDVECGKGTRLASRPSVLS